MKKIGKVILVAVLVFAFSSGASAQSRLIVRDTLGASALKLTCSLLGCTVQTGLGDPQGQVFLVTSSVTNIVSLLLGQLGIVNVEKDQPSKVKQSASTSGAPPALFDHTPVNYYGQTVWEGYVSQPATQIIGLSSTQAAFGVRGSGTVAVIDTGVDTTQPVLQGVLVPGYDFTRNQASGDEKGDVTQSTAAVLDGAQPCVVNQSTAAVLDQSTAAVLDGSQYAAFGHGTMVAGVIHLVAPRAFIMPLKAFNADGSGYLSDVIRAVNRATQQNVQVIHMSFSFPSYSKEMYAALSNASKKGIVSVASAGNDGQKTLVYPAAYQDIVIGVASTNNSDQRSTFSNYGSSLVWVAAPGEGIVTTYPYGTYAAAWGTSFSAPFVSGAAALLLDVHSATESQASSSVAHAKFISTDLGKGRLDLYQTLQAWLSANGK